MKITATQLEPTPPGNAFHHDAYHMGTRLSNRVMALHPHFPHMSDKSGNMNYLILCDEATGKRVKLEFQFD